MKMICAALAAAMLSGAASSAVLTYTVSGVFDDGTTLSGQFSFDPMGDAISQFTNVALRVGSYPTSATTVLATSVAKGVTYYVGSQANSPFNFQTYPVMSQDHIDIGVTGTTDGSVLKSITSPSLRVDAASGFGTRYEVNGTFHDLVAGGVTLAAVPEPATWAMMVAGFGAVGAGLRARRRLSLGQI